MIGPRLAVPPWGACCHRATERVEKSTVNLISWFSPILHVTSSEDDEGGLENCPSASEAIKMMRIGYRMLRSVRITAFSMREFGGNFV